MASPFHKSKGGRFPKEVDALQRTVRIPLQGTLYGEAQGMAEAGIAGCRLVHGGLVHPLDGRDVRLIAADGPAATLATRRRAGRTPRPRPPNTAPGRRARGRARRPLAPASRRTGGPRRTGAAMGRGGPACETACRPPRARTADTVRRGSGAGFRAPRERRFP